MEQDRRIICSAQNDLLASIELKGKLLVEGVNINPSVCSSEGRYKPRVESIYGHHVSRKPNFRIPQELILQKPVGLKDSEGIVVQLRYNPFSKTTLEMVDENPVLSFGNTQTPVDFVPSPGFYDFKTSLGTEVWRLAQLIGTDLIGIVPSNNCAYFAAGEECRFCELLPTYKEEKEYDKSTKPLSEQREALSLALSTGEGEYIALTSGNYDLENHRTIQSYVDVLPGLPKDRGVISYAFLMPPKDVSLIDRLKISGWDAVGFNLEVWRESLFPIVVPGKSRYLGRKKLLEALKHAVNIFGQGNVYTNFVYGIQSLDVSLSPDSYDPDEENRVCMDATHSLLQDGILPLFTIYHSTGKNKIGPIELSLDALLNFGAEHGRAVYESKLVPTDKNAIIYGLGSIANHFYNDYYYLAKTQEGK